MRKLTISEPVKTRVSLSDSRVRGSCACRHDLCVSHESQNMLNMSECVCVCLFLSLKVYTCIPTCMHACMHACMQHTCIHMDMQKHKHMHIDKNKQNIHGRKFYKVLIFIVLDYITLNLINSTLLCVFYMYVWHVKRGCGMNRHPNFPQTLSPLLQSDDLDCSQSFQQLLVLLLNGDAFLQIATAPDPVITRHSGQQY